MLVCMYVLLPCIALSCNTCLLSIGVHPFVCYVILSGLSRDAGLGPCVPAPVPLWTLTTVSPSITHSTNTFQAFCNRFYIPVNPISCGICLMLKMQMVGEHWEWERSCPRQARFCTGHRLVFVPVCGTS